MEKPDLLTRFEAFIDQASHLSDDADLTPGFNDFIRDASPLVLATALDYARRAHRPMREISRWITPYDLLSVAGISFVEDAYTELIRWAIDPSTHPPSALRRQLGWLSKLTSSDVVSGITEACSPCTQVVTSDGIPDLVLNYGHLLVIVEAKTGTDEHDAPQSGIPQTVAYPEAIRQKYGLSSATRVLVVYLTPDGRPAANPEAMQSTYATFVSALAQALDGVDLPDELRQSLRILFTHLLQNAVDSNLEVARGIQILGGARPMEAEEVRIHLPLITGLMRALPMEAFQ